MRIITIDIETLPTDEPFESRLFWDSEEEHKNTALDATLGRVLCIGFAEQNDAGTISAHGCFGWREETKDFESDEAATLNAFWEHLRGFNTAHDLIIGHNILNFDLPFIVQRSIINNVRPTVKIPFTKYRSAPVFDTMCEWDCWKWGRPTGLKKLAFALGLEDPKADGIDGSNIFEAYRDGRFEEIFRYCMRDVKTTRNVWRKMRFTYPIEKSDRHS